MASKNSSVSAASGAAVDDAVARLWELLSAFATSRTMGITCIE